MKKFEIKEDDFKKILLMLKLTKPHLNIPRGDLFLENLWRVAPKIGDKLLKLNKLAIIKHKGRTTVKDANDIPEDAEVLGGEKIVAETTAPAFTEVPTETPTETPTEAPIETPTDKPTEEVENTPTPTEHKHRCRKRKK